MMFNPSADINECGYCHQSYPTKVYLVDRGRFIDACPSFVKRLDQLASLVGKKNKNQITPEVFTFERGLIFAESA